MFEQLKEMNAELEALKKVHLEKSKAMFTNVSKLVFEKHPLLTSFGWRQYTPYFNDGDECIFSAHTDEPDINGIDGYDIDFEREKVTNYSLPKDNNGNYQLVSNEMYNPELNLALKDVKEFLSNIDDTVLRDMFGDHVKVTASSSGTNVEALDHD